MYILKRLGKNPQSVINHCQHQRMSIFSRLMVKHVLQHKGGLDLYCSKHIVQDMKGDDIQTVCIIIIVLFLSFCIHHPQYQSYWDVYVELNHLAI